DINECLDPQACGLNAECVNLPGNYTCQCREGYYGDPYNGCVDVDECVQPGVCGPGAICTNLEGGYRCDCPQGFDGDARSAQGCLDYDECARSPCGRNALCRNEVGSFRCECQQGFSGDPMTDCQDVDECSGNPCAEGAICINTPGGYRCKCPPGLVASDDGQCTDVNECAKAHACGENAKCINFPGSYKCLCPQGYEGRGELFCKNVNECLDNPCGENALCTDTVGSFICSCKPEYTGDPFRGCVDIDECSAYEKPCGEHAICENASPGYNCLCPQGYVGRPNAKVACEQADVNVLCTTAFDCTNNAECIEGQCFCQDGFEPQGSVCVDVDECRSGAGGLRKEPACGPSAVCVNTPGSYRCECEAGFIGTPPRVPCKPPCADVKCGKNAYCKAEGQEAFCICEEGWTFNPADIGAGCVDIDECDPAQGPNGRCGLNAVCTNHPGSYSCTCPPGYTGDATRQCQDVDECARPGACGTNALCKNLDGSHQCSCPAGSIADPDPSVRCISVTCGPNAHCMLVPGGGAQCLCSEGFTGQPGQCVDINECGANPCPSGAVCTNLPGGYTCQCPGGSSGDPYSGGCSKSALNACGESNPCPAGEKCVQDAYSGNSVCICGQGYKRDSKGRCRDVDECADDSGKTACGVNAFCKNLPGSYECRCPAGFNGNPYQSCDECHSAECRCAAPYKLMEGNCVLDSCSPDGKCPGGAECITITGGVSYCACPKGFRTLANGHCEDIDECGEGQQVCGYDAICLNTIGGFECKCPLGYSGDPYHGLCTLAQKRCAADRECGANERCVQPGECVCPPPYYMDAYDGNRCKSPCERFPCGMNARCTPSDPPQCMCEVGFKGDPLTGCIDEDECANSPCAYGAQCVNQRGGYKCVCPAGMVGDAYKGGCILEQGAVKSHRMRCGTNAECRESLASAECVCPGGFSGNPYVACRDVDECSAVGVCGEGAICINSEGSFDCRCRPGYGGNPFVMCSAIEKTVCTNPRQCQCGANMQCPPGYGCFTCPPNSVCVSSNHRGSCQCLPSYTGNPNDRNGCRPEQQNTCLTSAECAESDACVAHDGAALSCRPACESVQCGPYALCVTNNHGAQCQCPPGSYAGDPYDLARGCQSVPCVYNRDCPSNQLCNRMTHSCVDVCQEDTCGENAVCIAENHRSVCQCPPGYRANPIAEVECAQVRSCDPNPCHPSASCEPGPDGYVCKCPVGQIGNPLTGCRQEGACPGGDRDCPDGAACRVCQAGKCKCMKGFIGTPFGCTDIDECSERPCHASAVCENIPGSYRCQCPEGAVGDAYASPGCRKPSQCKCRSPCSTKQCSRNAECQVVGHRAECFCPAGYLGDATDGEIGGIGCFKVECVHNEDCGVERACSEESNRCVNPCEQLNCGRGTCQIQNHEAVCVCYQGYTFANGKCEDIDECARESPGPCHETALCENLPGNYLCSCPTGLVGDPVTAGCKRADECLSSEDCPSGAVCVDAHCQNPCAEANVCGENALCTCRNACNSGRVLCGRNADCSARNHVAECECKQGFYRDAGGICRKVECERDDDCSSDKCKVIDHGVQCSCPQGYLGNPLLGKCINPCLSPGACGLNAQCRVVNRQAQCSCTPGFFGNARHECQPVQKNGCAQNPCGENTICREDENGYECSCQPG
ncbi:AGAP010021-PA, partial [Anopheles gambiae str. PEST]